MRSLAIQPPDRRARRSSGRRSTTVTDSSSGRYVRARQPQGGTSDLALDATLRTAAPHQESRRAALSGDDAPTVLPAVLIEPWDIREKVRESKAGSLVLFVVDASGSMGAQRRMVAVKGAVLSILLDAYQRRDRVGLVSFRGTAAQLLLPPTNSVDLAQAQLREMPTGGRTPLSAGLFKAMEVMETERTKDRDVLPMLVLLSDGRANVTTAGAVSPTEEARAAAAIVREARIPAVVVDTEDGYVRLGLAASIAESMGARCIRLDDLRAETLADTVRLHAPTG